MGQSVWDNTFSYLQLKWSNISHNYLFCYVINSSSHIALNHLFQIWTFHFRWLNNAQDNHSTLKDTNTKRTEGSLVYLKMQYASTRQFSLPSSWTQKNLKRMLFFTPSHQATVVLYSHISWSYHVIKPFRLSTLSTNKWRNGTSSNLL